MADTSEQEANEPIARAMRRARSLAGLTQDEFGERLHASPHQVGRWEKGGKDGTVVPAHVLLQAAEVAGVDVMELLGMTDETTKRRVEELERRLDEVAEQQAAHARLLAALVQVPANRDAIEAVASGKPADDEAAENPA